LAVNRLRGSHKRTAHALKHEVEVLLNEFGRERCLFVTVGLKTGTLHVRDTKEAQRRFNSLATHVIRPRYLRSVWGVHRYSTGELHYHGLVVLRGPEANVFAGVDFEAFAIGDYRTAPADLRAEWKFLGNQKNPGVVVRYGFAPRVEAMPVKSRYPEAVGRYLGGYISKHVNGRLLEDKGARLVRYVGYKPGERKASSQFNFATERTWLRRQKVGAFVHRFGLVGMESLRMIVGPKWAYVLEEEIWFMPLPKETVYPSKEIAIVAMELKWEGERLRELHASCPLLTGCVGLRGAKAMNLLRRFGPPKMRQPMQTLVELAL